MFGAVAKVNGEKGKWYVLSITEDPSKDKDKDKDKANQHNYMIICYSSCSLWIEVNSGVVPHQGQWQFP